MREQWAELQSRLLESAYQVAREARHLLDASGADAASRLLTDYMKENTQKAQDLPAG